MLVGPGMNEHQPFVRHDAFCDFPDLLEPDREIDFIIGTGPPAAKENCGAADRLSIHRGYNPSARRGEGMNHGHGVVNRLGNAACDRSSALRPSDAASR